MALTVDWANKIIDSDASIPDLAVFHETLRDLEDDPSQGAIYKVTHTWKALDLGADGWFYQLDLINGYQLRFPSAGNYSIRGNLKGTIVPVVGVYVERETSAAHVTTLVASGSGLSAEQATILQEIYQRLGLDSANPLTNQSDGGFTTGTIDVDATTSGDDIIQTRQ